ncbi:MAG: diguanylate cyclase [Pseudomonadota bacterium]
MHGKILIVDAIPTNRIALKVKLSAAYYTVIQAGSVTEAEAAAAAQRPDLIIAAPQFADGDCIRLARRLMTRMTGGSVPILVQAPGLSADERVRLLGAGIDEVIAQPLSDALLMAQVRGLLRAQAAASEWSIRDDTARALGLGEAAAAFDVAPCVRLVATDPLTTARWRAALAPRTGARLSTALPQDATHAECNTDIFVIALERETPDIALSLLSSLRSQTGTRHAAILMLQDRADDAAAARALDLGADAVMQAQFDAAELSLRISRLARRKQMADQLRSTFKSGLKAAVSDPLTGLHNRRYAMPHLAKVAERARAQGKSFAVMVADLDHFKGVNDTYGHAAGDAVLVETARRLRENLRGADMVARIGGEEFLIVMPGVGLPHARAAAKRLCRLISDTPFQTESGQSLRATISIGLALGGGAQSGDAPVDAYTRSLVDKADQALYGAKNRGRNCVRLSRPAA